MSLLCLSYFAGAYISVAVARDKMATTLLICGFALAIITTQSIYPVLAIMFGAGIGYAVNMFFDYRNSTLKELIDEEYNVLMRKIPKFIELEADRKNNWVFLIQEGKFDNHVFHLERIKKYQMLYKYANAAEIELHDKEITDDSNEVAGMLGDYILMREDYEAIQ